MRTGSVHGNYFTGVIPSEREFHAIMPEILYQRSLLPGNRQQQCICEHPKLCLLVEGTTACATLQALPSGFLAIGSTAAQGEDGIGTC